MARSNSIPASPATWRAIAAGLTAMSLVSALIAGLRIFQALQLGVICGDGAGGLGHCWACYAAPLLGLSAVAAWSRSRVSPARARR